MIPAPHRYRDSRVPTDLRRLISVATPSLVVAAWRWRYEIALVSGLAAGLAAAISSFGAVPTIIAVIVGALTILCWRPARQFATDRAWCIITPHRVRVGCVEGLIYSSRGKIPIILWTSHRAFGERVSLYCRAGTTADDFVSARTVLATACWAQDVAVFVDPRHRQLVILDVIRRRFDELSEDLEGNRSAGPTVGPPPWPGDQRALTLLLMRGQPSASPSRSLTATVMATTAVINTTTQPEDSQLPSYVPRLTWASANTH
jgi:hypothetical protein